MSGMEITTEAAEIVPSCASTIGVVKRETNSWKWPTVMFVYMMAMAYVSSLVVFQTARALGL